MADHHAAYLQYIDEIASSEGFFVTSDYGRNILGGIFRIGAEDSDAFRKAEEAARFAIREYNEKENASLEFVRIANLNMEPAAGSMYYITLVVKDSSKGGEVNHYQTKVWATINTGFRAQIFRLANKSSNLESF